MAATTKMQLQQAPVSYSGFPVRKLTRHLGGDSGEWVTAYQASQRTRLKAVLLPSVRAGSGVASGSKVIRPPTNTREVSGVAKKVLDKEFLLNHCFVEEPTDLCVCNVSGTGLQDCISEDYHEFDSVAYINASDNNLPFEPFSTFPVLHDLELSLNGIMDIQVEFGDFKLLQRLDLSYNNLSGQSLLSLGMLPSLKELHLTGNNLVSLPVEMSRPFPTNESDSFEIRYPSLERLWLDDNKLSDQATFATLAGLRRLKYLNLNNNEIYSIPQLKLLGTSPLKQQPHSQEHQQQQDHPRPTSSKLTVDLATPGSTADQNQDVVTHHEQLKNGDDRTQAPHDGTANAAAVQSVELNEHSVLDVLSPLIGEEKLNTMVSIEDDGGTASVFKSEARLPQAPPNTALPLDQQTTPTIANPVDAPKQTTQSLHSILSKSTPATPTKSLTNPLYSSISAPQMLSNSSRRPPLHSRPIQSHGEVTPSDKCAPEVIEIHSRSDDVMVEERGGSSSPAAPLKDNMAPFPALETLSLVNNLILTEEGVIACGSWPSLKELVIYDNPLTRTSKGMPPLLKAHLVQGCAIKVVRKLPPAKKGYNIGNAAKDFKKVSSAPPPTIPKYPLPAIEAPPTAGSSNALKMLGSIPSLSHTHTPSSPHSFTTTDSRSESVTSEDGDGVMSVISEGVEGEGEEGVETKTADDDDEVQGVFLTQVDGEDPSHPVAGSPQRSWSVKEEFRCRRRETQERHRGAPQRYKGYEMLLDTYDDPSMNIPTDIYGCTRALQNALKHPLVLTDSVNQRPPVARHSPVKANSGDYLKRSPVSSQLVPVAGGGGGPSLAPIIHSNSKVRQLQGMLDDIRTHCNTLESNVAEVLQPRTPPAEETERRSTSRLQRESRKLLAEMQSRYDQVRASSLRTVHSASSELSSGRERHGQSGHKKLTPKTLARVTFS